MLNKEAKFTLDKPNSTEPTYIFLRYSCADGQLKYSIQEAILPDEWDFEKQRPLSKKNKRLENELVRIGNVVDQYREYCKKNNNQPVIKADLIEELQKNNIGKVTNVKPVEQFNFFTEVDTLIEEAKSGKLLNPKTGRRFSDGNIKKWKDIKSIFFKYNSKLTFSDINAEDFQNNFVFWCNRYNFSINYTATLLSTLKKWMEELYRKGVHKSLSYKSFKIKMEKSFQVYLNITDIQKLASLDLSNNKMNEIIRDRYIINLFTGLRISDMKTLTLDNFYFNDGIIQQFNKKTIKKAVIPIHQVLIDIIEKYKGELPKQYGEKKVRNTIKLLAKEAGINDEVRFTRTIGGRKVEFVEPKWKLIANHTARRSMFSNMILSGISVEQVASVGAITPETAHGYNRSTAEDNAAALQNANFFKTNPISIVK